MIFSKDIEKSDSEKKKEKKSKYNYVVRSGDSLMKLSFLTKYPVRQLKILNDLISDDLIPGQNLIIPVNQGFTRMIEQQAVSD